jgi:hypothetical protein
MHRDGRIKSDSLDTRSWRPLGERRQLEIDKFGSRNAYAQPLLSKTSEHRHRACDLTRV